MSNKGGELYNAERQLITRMVTNHGKLQAAQLLGIGKSTIYRKLKEYRQLEDIPVSKTQLVTTMKKCIDCLCNYPAMDFATARELGLALQKELDNISSF